MWVNGCEGGWGIGGLGDWVVARHCGNRTLENSESFIPQYLATTNGVRWFLTFELPIQLAILNFELVILNCLA
jgi:hypothetical protein